jgi:membrane-associated protease RseP (regulator of RpoE activity)
VLFASAGSLMHLVMALVLAWVSLTLVGVPSSSHIGINSFTPWDGHSRNAAQIAGMKIGDQIVSINGHPITNSTTLVTTVHDSVGTTLTVVVARHGHDLTLHATPVDGRTLKVNGKTLVSGSTPQGYLGIGLENLVAHTSILAAVPSSFHTVGYTLWLTTIAMAHVFSPGEFSSLFHQVASPSVATSPTVENNRPRSIVGIAQVAVQSAHAGIGVLLEILMAVNISIGLLNMIPMLPLDGGYVAVSTYERLRSRRGHRYHADINRMVPYAYAFMTVLLVLFLSTMYLDIVHPIANPFQ